MTWQTLQTIVHSFRMHTHVYDEYINFAFTYTTNHIFNFLPTKHLLNQYGEPTTLHKLDTGTKLLLSNPHVLFFTCVVQKSDYACFKMELNINNQSQRGFWGIFIVITQHKKGASSTYIVHRK